jgi:hypothetical protein
VLLIGIQEFNKLEKDSRKFSFSLGFIFKLLLFVFKKFIKIFLINFILNILSFNLNYCKKKIK